MTTTIPLSLRLEMLSDWHIGSGGGRHGALDRLLDRDADALPYVPGSTLRGIWRDAAEKLAHGLDSGKDDGPWAELVNLLFGSQPSDDDRHARDVTRPRRGALRIDDLRYPEALRQWLKSDQRLAQAVAFAKPGVAIDKASGRAKENFLRFEEVGRKGSVLIGGGELILPDGMDEEQALAFLAAAAKLVERLGGKRRRGNGRCMLAVTFNGREITDFKPLEKEPRLPTDDHKHDGKAELSFQGFSTTDKAGEWVDVPIVATLETPVIIPDRVMGNVVSGLPFIPGFYLLKAVARAFDDQAAFWKAIAAGDIQVGPLYPEVDGEVGCPAPACFEKRKLGGDAARNILLKEDEDKDASQYKPLRGGFVAGDQEELMHLGAPAMRVRTHNTVEDEKQRPTEEVGGVFSFEAIAPGQVFHGHIRMKKEWRDRMGQLPNEVRLGRAARMGYGRVRLETGKAEELKPPALCDDGAIWIWALSDILLPGVNLCGGTHLDALIKAVEAALGVQIDQDKSKAALLTRRLESWQASWGLPRPSLVAIAAGSVARLVLEDGQSVDAAKLARLQAEGLGERRGEGFGRIAVNDPVVMAKEIVIHSAERNSGKKNSDNDSEKQQAAILPREFTAFAEQIERTAWQQAIAEQAETMAANENERMRILGWKIERKGKRINGKPVASQLGALRTLLGMTENNFRPIISWLEHIEEKGTVDKWGGAAVTGKLKCLFLDNTLLWDRIGTPESGWPKPLVHNEEHWKQVLWPWAVKTFLLQAMHYHRREAEKADRPTRKQNTPEHQEAAS